MLAKHRLLLFMAMMICAAPTGAPAGVGLSFIDNDGTDSGWLGAKGATFQLTLNITSSEATTGLDYYLNSPDGSGLFSITARDISTSSYHDPLNSDASVAAGPTANQLNPRNDLDLGASLDNVSVANVPGTYLVAKYTILVSAAAALDTTYTIQTVSNPNTGWVGPSPNFDEHQFNQHASYSITVATPQWNRDTSASWNTNTNWSDNIIPNSSTAVANFLGRINVPSTVSMDGNKSLNIMNIDSTIPYTISRGSGTLTMLGSAPAINIKHGSHTISTFITWSTVGAMNVFNDTSVVLSGTNIYQVNGTMSVGANASATISGPLTIGKTAAPAAAATLTKTGTGTLTIVTGAQTAVNGSILQAQGGITNLNVAMGAPATATAAAVPNLTVNVNTGVAKVNLGVDQNLRNVTVSYLDPGEQGLDLSSPTTAGAFRSLRIYAADLVSAKNVLWFAIMNAAANPGDGIFDSGISAHPNSRVAIAQLPDAHGDQSLLIRPAIVGDLNMDNQVTIADFIGLASHFNQAGTWQEGDINLDGNVTIADFVALASSFGQTYAGGSVPVSAADRAILADFAAANVPEPGIIAAGGLMACILVGRKRHSPQRVRS